MDASIVLDQPGNVSFTNLDQISGKVVVRCSKSSDIRAIIVKLEGESRTRLLSPAGPNGKKATPQLEYHKILYRVQMVFPDAHVVEGRSWTAGNAAYTLGPGNHEYPFKFKLPFNNACADEKGQIPTVSISGNGVEVVQAPTRHVKKTLPPTLSGFPGEAEIRYFLKVTVNRHSFWRENPRAYAPFNFFPIEPPRPALSGYEVYGRQKHSFDRFPDGESSKSGVKGMFSRSKEPDSTTTDNEPPTVTVDARLPEPAILTCNDDIPLRILVKKLNDCDAMIHLQSLQVSLIGTTKIRAHNLFRTETNSWVLMSKSNMGMPIGAVSDHADTESVIPDSLWRGRSLPNTVAPSFETCNITRKYQLDVRVGLSYHGLSPGSSKPQNVVLPLRLDVQVFSGIAPPRELLEAMAEARASIGRISSKATVDADRKNPIDPRKDSVSSIPETPMEGPGGADVFHFPAQQGHVESQPAYSDAPPSYEDAIASQMAPINAPRPDYAPPPFSEDDVLRTDEKKGDLMHRRDS